MHGLVWDYPIFLRCRTDGVVTLSGAGAADSKSAIQQNTILRYAFGQAEEEAISILIQSQAAPGPRISLEILAFEVVSHVAQIFNLLYRRISFCKSIALPNDAGTFERSKHDSPLELGPGLSERFLDADLFQERLD